MKRNFEAIFLLLALIGVAQAQTTTWTAGTDDWLTGSNWDLGVPTSSLDAVIANGGTATLTGVGEVGELKIGSGGSTSGSLVIDGGSLVAASNSSIGFYGGTGSAAISGGAWSTAYSLMVGHLGGEGTLDISGGTVESSTSNVGYGGSGLATVTGGSWSAGDLYIGVNATQNGAGVLTVSGGSVTATSVQLNHSLGYEATSTGTVNLNDGVLATQQVTELTGTGGGQVNFNGGTLQATADSSDFLTGFSAGDVQIAAGGAKVDTQGHAVAITVPLQGAGGLVKLGSGTLELAGTSTYTGPTTVSAGTLNISGSIAASSLTTVASGATLAGSGTVGDLVVGGGGTLSPGNSPGALSAGGTTFSGGGNFLWQINSTGGTAGGDPGWDLLSISGVLAITATPENPFTISLASLAPENTAGNVSDFDAGSTYSFVFASASGGITGFSAADFEVVTTDFSNAFTGVWTVTSDGYNLVLNYAAASAVPEPSTYAALAGAAMLGLALWRRRRRSVAL